MLENEKVRMTMTLEEEELLKTSLCPKTQCAISDRHVIRLISKNMNFISNQLATII